MKAAIAFALVAGLSGCAVMHTSPTSWEVHPISKAGAEVQRASFKKRGIIILLSDQTSNGLPTITVGTLEVDLTRVPFFPKGFTVPSITATSKLDVTTGAHIEDSLEVGTYTDEPEPSPAPEAERP